MLSVRARFCTDACSFHHRRLCQDESQRNVFMQHGSSVMLVFLYLAAALHGCGASSACAPTIATVGTSSDRTGGCEETDRTSTCRSTRQDHAAEPNGTARNESDWPGGRHSCPGEARQVRWQRKRRGQTASSVAKAYAGAIDQQLSDDMTKAEISTTVLNNDSTS